MRPRCLVTLAGTWVLLACNPHPLKVVEYSSESEAGGTVDVSINKDVDILFIIDNSASMSEEQATLARNFASFIEVLERDEVKANYRIAVTTTDVGHNWAQGCNAPENGRLQLTSCRDREGSFTYNGEDEEAFELACLDVCDHDRIEVMPTTTHLDPAEERRPWVESFEGLSNLPDGVSTTEAFSCFGPQGTGGCGFEMPLEAMYRALIDTQTQDSPSYGFIRPGAILAVVIVTDEVDCSARLSPLYESVWDGLASDAPKTFWIDENRGNQWARSDVCWNAGVACETGDDGLTTCRSEDYAVEGGPGDPETSVLFPLSRYTTLLDGFEADKKRLFEDQEVLVAVIAGVPPGYSTGDEVLDYDLARATDPDFYDHHGVAPGCEHEGTGKAAPPVRLREFAEHYATEGRNVFSVCNDDYSPALEAIADLIADQIRPACVETCAADVDPLVDGVQPACIVDERVLDVATGLTTETPIERCLATSDGFAFPEGVDVCYRPVVGEAMSPECVDEGWNLELSIERREGTRAASGTSIVATCSASQNLDRDCPGLP